MIELILVTFLILLIAYVCFRFIPAVGEFPLGLILGVIVAVVAVIYLVSGLGVADGSRL